MFTLISTLGLIVIAASITFAAFSAFSEGNWFSKSSEKSPKMPRGSIGALNFAQSIVNYSDTKE